MNVKKDEFLYGFYLTIWQALCYNHNDLLL